jgi:hypothetical protein|tara:strand:+ start:53 stop:340 length:288 start_codon:yes stop_codon:yes gene_type:complete
MDFLEDLEMYEQSMQNAYDLITRKQTLDDVYDNFEDNGIKRYYLPFDPIEEDGRTEDIIDMVIDHFTSYEEYEKCAELVKIKECLNKQIELDQQH